MIFVIVQLRREASPTHEVIEPLDLLQACHGRIRMVTELAGKLSLAAGADEREIVDVARRVERFYSIGIRLHAEDEDQSMMPRLLPLVPPDIERALMRMNAEHLVVDELSLVLADLCRRLFEEPGRFRELSPALRACVREVEVMWASHLVLEERVIFPRLSLVPAETRRVMADEIRARRKRPGVVEAMRAAVSR